MAGTVHGGCLGFSIHFEKVDHRFGCRFLSRLLIAERRHFVIKAHYIGNRRSSHFALTCLPPFDSFFMFLCISGIDSELCARGTAHAGRRLGGAE